MMAVAVRQRELCLETKNHRSGGWGQRHRSGTPVTQCSERERGVSVKCELWFRALVPNGEGLTIAIPFGQMVGRAVLAYVLEAQISMVRAGGSACM